MTTPAAVILWLAWAVVVARTGYTATGSDDRIDDRATRVSMHADVATVASMVAAVAAATWVPAADVAGPSWIGVLVGTVLVASGAALRRSAVHALGSWFTRSVSIADNHHVVTEGPYRYVRHPSYAGLLLSLIGLAVTLWNLAGVAIMVVGSVAAQVVRIRAEDEALERGLGAPYREYERSHKRLIPGVW